MTGAMAAPYELVLLHDDDDGWASAVGRATTAALEALVGDGAAVRFSDTIGSRAGPVDPGDHAGHGPHTVVVFLADADGRCPSNLLAALDAARRQALPILPLVRTGMDVSTVLPPAIRSLQSVVWSDDPEQAVHAILRLLGLVERDRRLFLSYRSSESSPLARQLLGALTERAYDVFLDRFSVPPATDFQRRLDIELSDKAFVLLLESPSATRSQWVQHEVSFALSHRISLLALALPQTHASECHPSIPETMRRRLRDRDLTPAGELTAKALEWVLSEIEASYAAQLRRRRTGMLDTLREWLDRAGTDPQQADGAWALSASWPRDGASVFLITPRAPTPRDMHELDRLRRGRERARGANVGGVLACGAPVQDADDRELIGWVAENRPLAVHPLMAMKGILGA